MLSFAILAVAFAILAQAGQEFGTKQIAEYGFIASAFGFVLMRIEPQLRLIVKALGALTQMIGVMLAELKNISAGGKEVAKRIVEGLKEEK